MLQTPLIKAALIKKYTCLCLLYFFLVTRSLFAVADETDKDSFNRLELDLVYLHNPQGLSISAKGYHRQVYHHDNNILWDSLYYQWGAQANITPAFSRAGVHFEWMPIAVLQLRAQYDKLYFAGSNGSLLAFTSPTQAFGDDQLEAREGDEVSGDGERASLHLTLRVKFNKTIIRNVTNFAYYRFPGNGPYYLEREHELLMATKDHVISNQLFFLFENKTKDGTHFFGPYHEYTQVRNSNLTSERLGLTWFKEYNKAFSFLQKPRWYIQAGTYLQEPNRENEIYLVIGIGGDY